MKPGLRLQILLLLGGLMLLAFVPLFFAVATYTRLTLQQVRETSARALGRAVASHVAEARGQRSVEALAPLLESEIGTEGVEAMGVFDRDGKPLLRLGDPVAALALGKAPIDPSRERVFEVGTSHGRGIAVTVPDPQGAVVAVVRTDDQSARAAPLVRLVGLYTAVVALALLILAYFALTRLIVRPLDQLSRAAERVAGGARRFDVPPRGARELAELGVSLRTMTEKLLAEEEALRRKIDEVEKATDRLGEAQARLVRSERLASVGRLAAGLAHEIGNPIAALIGMQDLLLEGGLEPEEQRDFLQRMRKESERIHRILRDLLQFARPGQTRPEDAGSGDVEAAVYDTVALVTPQKSMQDVELAVDVFPDLPPVSLGREHLVQVVLNLILNAADACGPGGKITLRARATPSGVRLEVEDTGPGVAAEVRDRLFEPFVTTKEVGKGTGLGLAVCRGLVEGAGGSIALDDGYEGGARFVIELPKFDAAVSSRRRGSS
ncbi:MAG: HAMP domain-containing sensor histidine kinase [Polyangiaceae bacterium]